MNTFQLIISVGLVVLLVILFLGGIFEQAEDGYQDETGYHKGSKPCADDSICLHDSKEILGYNDKSQMLVCKCRLCGLTFEV